MCGNGVVKGGWRQLIKEVHAFRAKLDCLEPTREARRVATASRLRPVASGSSLARMGAMSEGKEGVGMWLSAPHAGHVMACEMVVPSWRRSTLSRTRLRKGDECTTLVRA